MAKRGRKPGTKFPEYIKENGKVDYTQKYSDKKGKIRYPHLSQEQKAQIAFTRGNPQKKLQCPFCGKTTPIKVAVNTNGEPKKSPGRYTKYVTNNGVIERRFTGIPKDKLTPVCTEYMGGGVGFHIKPQESMPPSLLRKVDAELYDEFKQILLNTVRQFP